MGWGGLGWAGARRGAVRCGAGVREGGRGGREGGREGGEGGSVNVYL